MRAEDFFALKNPTTSVVFEPATLGTIGQHATSRPPKPFCNSLLLSYSTTQRYTVRVTEGDVEVT